MSINQFISSASERGNGMIAKVPLQKVKTKNDKQSTIPSALNTDLTEQALKNQETNTTKSAFTLQQTAFINNKNSFLAKMTDLMHLIKAYQDSPNETNKAQCNAFLTMALTGLSPEVRYKLMQMAPETVLSYYETSYKKEGLSGDKKEFLAQAQNNQEKQIAVLSIQQIELIKQQTRNNYQAFWAKHNSFNWENASPEEMRKWAQEDAKMKAEWYQNVTQQIKNASSPEEAKIILSENISQRKQDVLRLINTTGNMLKNQTLSPEQKEEIQKINETQTKEFRNLEKTERDLVKLDPPEIDALINACRIMHEHVPNQKQNNSPPSLTVAILANETLKKGLEETKKLEGLEETKRSEGSEEESTEAEEGADIELKVESITARLNNAQSENPPSSSSADRVVAKSSMLADSSQPVPLDETDNTKQNDSNTYA